MSAKQIFEGSVGGVADGDINIKQQNVIQLLLEKSAASKTDGNADLKDILEFQKLTKMKGVSKPALPYLRALLREDITIPSVRKIWSRELKYSEALRLHVMMPRKPYFLLIMLAVGWVFSAAPLALMFILAKGGTLVSLSLFSGFAIFTAAFFWGCVDLLLPYQICLRLLPMVDKVNADMGSKGNAK